MSFGKMTGIVTHMLDALGNGAHSARALHPHPHTKLVKFLPSCSLGIVSLADPSPAQVAVKPKTTDPQVPEVSRA